MGWNFALPFQPYGEGWRMRRREIHQQFRAVNNPYYHPKIMKHAHRLINNLLASPNDFMTHIRRYPGSITLSVAYDYDVAPQDDRFLNIVEEAVEMLVKSVFPGAVAVNALPILQHLPAWLPGMGFKRFAQKCNRLTMEIKNAPIDFVKARMESGVPTSCVTTELFNRLCDSDGRLDVETEDVIKDVAAITYAAGADTTISAIMTGFLAMALYPEAKDKAQKEIDAVVGNMRLPTLEGKKALPYVEAFFREVLRWHPVLPMSIEHCAYEDDVYEGQFIPRGATVLMNTWAFHHDEDTYPESDVFKPERYLERNGGISDKYPMTAFGMGRRICPGRHLAESAVWVALALVLATLDVKKAHDETGREIDIAEDYYDVLTSRPKPFVCSIKPRSKQAETLISEAHGFE